MAGNQNVYGKRTYVRTEPVDGGLGQMMQRITETLVAIDGRPDHENIVIHTTVTTIIIDAGGKATTTVTKLDENGEVDEEYTFVSNTKERTIDGPDGEDDGEVPIPLKHRIKAIANEHHDVALEVGVAFQIGEGYTDPAPN